MTERIRRMGPDDLDCVCRMDLGRFEAIVVGGGTAGAIAALSLAQNGHKVLVIERMNCLGGMGCAGHIERYYYGSRGGLYEQVDIETKALEVLGYTASDENGYNAELKKRVLEERLTGLGARIEFNADLTGVIMEDNRVTGIEFYREPELCSARADYVIDATAEAYVCLLAGADYTLGRELDGRVQPYGNVRIDFSNETLKTGHSYTDCGYADPLDPVDYSRAVLSAANFACYMKDDYSGKTRLLGITPNVGMREGPLIMGEDRLHFADTVNRKNLSGNTLFTAYSNADNHGKDMAFENTPQQDWMIACSLWGLNFTVNVPVGCVIPKGIIGLLMAGRMISVDHELASCIRMQRDIQKCGEAVALLASEAIRRQCDVRDVPYDALRTRLEESGCLLQENDFGYIDSKYPLTEGRVFFPETPEEIRQGLAGNEPGMAIWRSASLVDERMLKDALNSGNENLSAHAAMGLALRGDDSGAPRLLRCVRERDPYVPGTSRKYNMIRGAAAIYLLGRLHYLPALEDILDVIRNWDTLSQKRFVPDEFLANEEEYRFQFLTMAVMAVLKITEKWPAMRENADMVIHQVIDREDFSIHSTLKGKDQVPYQMAPIIREAVHITESRRKTVR